MQLKQILEDLESVRQRIHAGSLGAVDLQAVKKVASQMTRELNVLETLAATGSWLWESQADKKHSKRSADHKSRLIKMVREVHGAETSPNNRLAKLSALDTETFLFVAASYTPLGIQRLEQNVFECVLHLAPQYVANASLPSGWIHREVFQVAVSCGAKKGGFKRKYQDLEYTEAPKRPRSNTSEHPTTDGHFHAGSSPSQYNGIPPYSNNTLAQHSNKVAQESDIVAEWNTASAHMPVWAFGSIEAAFAIPREKLSEILGGLSSEVGIMTIPTHDWVASIVHTITREEAFKIGERYLLERLLLPMSG